MADHLPLLVFPNAKMFTPPKGDGFPPDKSHLPNHSRQVERLTKQLDDLQRDFSSYKASISGTVAGLEPETVLVIEIAGSVEGFKQTIDDTSGLEWLGEWDIDDIEPDDDFFQLPKIGVDFFKNNIEGITNRTQSREIRDSLLKQKIINYEGYLIVSDIEALSLPEHLAHLKQDVVNSINNAIKEKRLKGRLFLSFTNEQGLSELLALWQLWEKKRALPYNKTKWRDVFSQTRKIRRWGIQETLRESGMIEHWQDLLNPIEPVEKINCQIELFYHSNPVKRQQNEKAIISLLEEIGGQVVSNFIDMERIAFHAVKAQLPADRVRHLIDLLESHINEVDIKLFRFPGVMYFRPTGQSLVTLDEDDSAIEIEFPDGFPELPPIVGILDGAPNLQHKALKDRLEFDDPDNLSAQYLAGERKHGTAMASLVVHGELPSSHGASLARKVYHLAVMQPDPKFRDLKQHREYIPDEVFFEDRIERAVRRMFEGEGSVPAQAPEVKIINLSIGDPERPFIHTPSPWARLLDWLSWKYRVLFCVSAGNFEDKLNLSVPYNVFSEYSDEKKVTQVLRSIKQYLLQRRLLSPAESLNALTIGALHADNSGDYVLGNRIDLLPSNVLFSPISRFGYGFRRSIKPEILFPGGRQLFHTPVMESEQSYTCAKGFVKPGQQVAWDSDKEGVLSKTAFSRGTSNATALATRGGAMIYEILLQLQDDYHDQIQDNLLAVLIKALLVHGAQHLEQAEKALTNALKTENNSRRFKEVMSRYIGYGEVNIERVLACTEQRATVIGCGEIQENQIHEYRFPLPLSLSGIKEWRRMVVTLAWFTPINPSHRHLREAKLSFQPDEKWGDMHLRLKRTDSDDAQVLRGTVQHEILEGENQISAYEEDDHLLLRITCKADATENLDQVIPYGLAVTLEVKEDVNIPIYTQIRTKIRPKVVVPASVEN